MASARLHDDASRVAGFDARAPRSLGAVSRRHQLKVSCPSAEHAAGETTVELGLRPELHDRRPASKGGNNESSARRGLGNLTIIGACPLEQLQPTDGFIVVTPSGSAVSRQIARRPTLPQRNTSERIGLDIEQTGQNGTRRPGPTVAPPQTVQPGVGGISSLPAPSPAAPAQAEAKAKGTRPEQQASAAPGFSF